VSSTHGGPSGSGKKSSGMASGDHGEPESGTVTHMITKEVTSNAAHKETTISRMGDPRARDAAGPEACGSP
jgi:hypothetical protein